MKRTRDVTQPSHPRYEGPPDKSPGAMKPGTIEASPTVPKRLAPIKAATPVSGFAGIGGRDLKSMTPPAPTPRPSSNTIAAASRIAALPSTFKIPEQVSAAQLRAESPRGALVASRSNSGVVVSRPLPPVEPPTAVSGVNNGGIRSTESPRQAFTLPSRVSAEQLRQDSFRYGGSRSSTKR